MWDNIISLISILNLPLQHTYRVSYVYPESLSAMCDVNLFICWFSSYFLLYHTQNILNIFCLRANKFSVEKCVFVRSASTKCLRNYQNSVGDADLTTLFRFSIVFSIILDSKQMHENYLKDFTAINYWRQKLQSYTGKNYY